MLYQSVMCTSITVCVQTHRLSFKNRLQETLRNRQAHIPKDVAMNTQAETYTLMVSQNAHIEIRNRYKADTRNNTTGNITFFLLIQPQKFTYIHIC